MQNSIYDNIQIIKSIALEQYIKKYDIDKQFDFISKSCNEANINEQKLKKDIIKKNIFFFIKEIMKSKDRRKYIEGFFASLLSIGICIIALISNFIKSEDFDFVFYANIGFFGIFGIIGFWGFNSNLDALKYYADLYAKEFIRFQIFHSK